MHHAMLCRSVVDVDGSGTLDAQEFSAVLDQLRNMADLPKSSLKPEKEWVGDGAKGNVHSLY